MNIFLLLKVLVGLPIVVFIMGVLLFLPAGTLDWLDGWIYLVVTLVFLIGYFGYFLITDPETLQRREKLSSSPEDQRFLFIIGILYITLLIVPGLDFKYQWSQLPSVVKLLGNIVVILAYIFIFLVVQENQYVSKGLTIHEDQKVITTGPYAVVRHPMYVGFSLLFIGTAIALGSLIAFLPTVLLIGFLISRIRPEEKMLLEELDGYEEYMEQVPYRLIPKLW